MAVRGRFGECVQRLAAGDDALYRGDACHLNLEHPHHRDDAGQTNVGHGGHLAMAESAGLRLARQPLLHRLQAGGEPLDLPGAPSGIVKLAMAFRQTHQVFFDAWCDQGMRVRGQHGGK